MRMNDFNMGVVRTVVDTLGEAFYTADVADHRDMLAAHPGSVTNRNYRATVGKILKRLTDGRGLPLLTELQKGGSRGSEWRKGDFVSMEKPVRSSVLQGHMVHDQQERGASTRQFAGDGVIPQSASDTTTKHPDIGPQYAGDSAFAARMRRHQSWYRAAILKVPYGTGPGPKAESHYGNMLHREDGELGLNFITPGIFAVVRRRIAQHCGALESFRLLHNMLSSQPMCFNLFGPLVEDYPLATRVFRQIVPDVAEVVEVVIEYAPTPAGEYLADRTAFDAFVEFVQVDGRPGFVGIETKLTEPFSQRLYDTPAYRRWSDRPESPWLAEARDRLAEIGHNQLWRDHLLAIAMRSHPKSRYASGFFMLVRHPQDRECASVVSGYSALLKPSDCSFIDCPLDRLVRAVESAVETPVDRDWLKEFQDRYLNLALSGTTFCMKD